MRKKRGGGRQKKLIGLTSAADSGAKSATLLCRGAGKKEGSHFPSALIKILFKLTPAGAEE